MGKHSKRHIRAVDKIPQPRRLNPPTPFRAFTIKFSGRTNRIVTPLGITPAFDPTKYQDKEPPFSVLQKTALWDTGATNSVLTSGTVKELDLTPIGATNVNHAGGTSLSKTYLVNFMLPNGVGVSGVIVSECEDIAGEFGAIIGMDIITRGDLALTNVNNETCMSFRIPSMQTIDYVMEFNHLLKKS
jgi:hypothetical protein